MPDECLHIVNHPYSITKWIKLIQFGHKYYSNKLVLVEGLNGVNR